MSDQARNNLNEFKRNPMVPSLLFALVMGTALFILFMI